MPHPCTFQCGAVFEAGDVITLNGTDEEVEELCARMQERRLQNKLSKVQSHEQWAACGCVKNIYISMTLFN